MTKRKLISKLSKRVGVDIEVVQAVLDTFADEVTRQLMKGESVHMRGFCTFTVEHRAQKLGRLIKKKAPVLIPAHDQPVFKPSIELKKKMKKTTSKDIVFPI